MKYTKTDNWNVNELQRLAHTHTQTNTSVCALSSSVATVKNDNCFVRLHDELNEYFLMCINCRIVNVPSTNLSPCVWFIFFFPPSTIHQIDIINKCECECEVYIHLCSHCVQRYFDVWVAVKFQPSVYVHKFAGKNQPTEFIRFKLVPLKWTVPIPISQAVALFFLNLSERSVLF